MKIYANTFDLKKPAPKVIQVLPWSDFKISIQIIDGDSDLISAECDGIELEADEELYAGYKLFKFKSGALAKKVLVKYGTTTFYLTVLPADTNIFEVAEGSSVDPSIDAALDEINGEVI